MTEKSSQKPESREEIQKKFDRFGTADTIGDALTKKNVDVATKNAKEKVDEEISKIERERMGEMFSSFLGTNIFMPIDSKNGKEFQKMMQYILLEPFKEIGKEWKQTLQQASEMKKGDKNFSIASINEFYTERLKDSSDLINAYILKIAKFALKNKIDANILVQMYEDVNKRAEILTEALVDIDNEEIKKTLLWAFRGDAELKDTAFKTIEKEITENFGGTKKEEIAKMDLVWMAISFLEDSEKIKIAKKVDDKKKRKFLEVGNSRGIYSSTHFKEVLGLDDKAFDEQFDREKIQGTYEKVNDFSTQAQNIIRDQKESRNYINKIFTAENFITLYAKFFAITSVVGNSIMTISSHGFSASSVEKILTNGKVLLGAGIYGVAALKDKDRLDRFLADSGERSTNVKKVSRNILNQELHGSHGEKWDSFFTSNSYAGSAVFYDFIQAQKKKKDGKFEQEDFTSVNFIKYLDEQEKNPNNSDIPYKSVKRSFADSGLKDLGQEADTKIYKFAQAFDGLSMRGKQYKDELRIIRSEKPKV